MTTEEYVQLKAFARQDGAILSIALTGGFVCYLLGMTNPSLGLAALLLVGSSPFLAAKRLRRFRDHVLEGSITFLRGYAYTILMFFYAGILLAAVVYIYFAFIDKGYLIGTVSHLFSTQEGRQVAELYGMTEQIKEGLKVLAETSPIDFAVNMLSVNITSGLLLGLPIAALSQRKAAASDSLNHKH